MRGARYRLETRGDRIAVRGRLQTKVFEKEGDRRTYVEIVAAEIEFLFTRGRKSADAATADGGPEAEADAEELEDLPEAE